MRAYMSKITRSRARSRIGFFVVPDRSHVLYCRACQDNRRACGGRMHIFTDKTFAEAHSQVRICDCYFAFVFCTVQEYGATVCIVSD